MGDALPLCTAFSAQLAKKIERSETICKVENGGVARKIGSVMKRKSDKKMFEFITNLMD